MLSSQGIQRLIYTQTRVTDEMLLHFFYGELLLALITTTVLPPILFWPILSSFIMTPLHIGGSRNTYTLHASMGQEGKNNNYDAITCKINLNLKESRSFNTEHSNQNLITSFYSFQQKLQNKISLDFVLIIQTEKEKAGNSRHLAKPPASRPCPLSFDPTLS